VWYCEHAGYCVVEGRGSNLGFFGDCWAIVCFVGSCAEHTPSPYFTPQALEVGGWVAGRALLTWAAFAGQRTHAYGAIPGSAGAELPRRC
jgi:hypothetical protein